MPHRAIRAGAAASLLVGALLLGAGCSHAGPGAALETPAVSALPPSPSSHVIVLLMENEEATEVIGNPAAPYINLLARRYGLATQSYAIGHPSLPNYLALTSGSTQGVTSDCTDCHFAAPNIVDQLEAAGISWKAYLEDEPYPCFRGASAGAYVKKHNPFIYYDDVAGSAHRCQKLVGFGQLATDLRSGGLPTYAWISPNLCDDGHDCGLSAGDRFLARTVPVLVRELGPNGVLVLTWDEGSSDDGCCGIARGGHITTIVAGPDVRRGARNASPIDHYGVLATVESTLGLPLLRGAGDRRGGSLASLLRSPHIALHGRG